MGIGIDWGLKLIDLNMNVKEWPTWFALLVCCCLLIAVPIAIRTAYWARAKYGTRDSSMDALREDKGRLLQQVDEWRAAATRADKSHQRELAEKMAARAKQVEAEGQLEAALGRERELVGTKEQVLADCDAKIGEYERAVRKLQFRLKVFDGKVFRYPHMLEIELFEVICAAYRVFEKTTSRLPNTQDILSIQNARIPCSGDPRYDEGVEWLEINPQSEITRILVNLYGIFYRDMDSSTVVHHILYPPAVTVHVTPDEKSINRGALLSVASVETIGDATVRYLMMEFLERINEFLPGNFPPLKLQFEWMDRAEEGYEMN